MKGKLAILLLILASFTLAGCSFGKHPTVFLWVYLEPESTYTAANPVYRAFCKIDDRNLGPEKVDYKDAVVKIDNLVLQIDKSGTFSTGMRPDLRLKPGEKVKVKVSHPKLRFSQTVVIPPLVTKLISTDNVEDYAKGKLTSFTIKWEKVKSDSYLAKAYFYPDASGNWTDVYSNQALETTSTFSGQYLDDLKASRPYLKFQVNALNSYTLKNFAQGSVVQVVGPGGSSLSNLPESGQK